jgi:hypothetical protein
VETRFVSFINYLNIIDVTINTVLKLHPFLTQSHAHFSLHPQCSEVSYYSLQIHERHFLPYFEIYFEYITRFMAHFCSSHFSDKKCIALRFFLNFIAEDGGSMFLRNFGTYLQVQMALLTGISTSTYAM